MTLCRARGCRDLTATAYSHYCPRHKSRLRRHGSVDQTAITKAHLAGHLRTVRARIAKNAASGLWDQLEARWEALRGHASGIAGSTRAMVSYQRTAALEVVRLASAVTPQAVLETALAMFLMREEEPHSFRSDQAFRSQLVRRVRGLSDLNAQLYEDGRSGRTKTVYRELPPRASEVLGQWLAETFGAAGLHLARLEVRDRQREAEGLRIMHRALEELV